VARPFKPAGTKLAITALRIPPKTKVKLEALSHQSGLAQQEHIRRALDAYFYDLQQKGEFNADSVRPKDAPRRGRPPVKEPEQPARRVFRRPGMSAAA
jgi:hypothetical protein